MVLDQRNIVHQDTLSPCCWEAEPQSAMSDPTHQINSLAGYLLTNELHLTRGDPPPTVSLAMAPLRESCTAWAEEDLETSAWAEEDR